MHVQVHLHVSLVHIIVLDVKADTVYTIIGLTQIMIPHYNRNIKHDLCVIYCMVCAFVREYNSHWIISNTAANHTIACLLHQHEFVLNIGISIKVAICPNSDS